MSSSQSSILQCQEIVEALRNCIDSTRPVYEDDLSADARKERLKEGDSRLSSLVTALDSTVVNIKRDRNCYLPINRLFNELLLEIWSYLALADRFSISQVSHRWRQVALASSSLWTLIDLELNNTPKIRKLLERAGIAPLHIVSSIKKFYNPSYKPISNSFSSYNERNVQPYNAYYPIYTNAGELRKHIPFFTQKEFDGIFGRCSTLDAFIGDSKGYYVTPKLLKNAMPHLRTLRLMQDQSMGYAQDARDTKPLGQRSIPYPVFGGRTPLLRELCFEWIHARWSDPIYRNLTNLRLFYPRNPPTIGQLLRVLGSSPDLTHLELIGCLKPDISPPLEEAAEYPNEGGPVVEEEVTEDSDHLKTISLPKLTFFHVNDFEDDAIRELLSYLELPRLDYLFVGAPTYACITDKYGRPLKSLLATIRRPKELRIAAQIEYFLFFARLRDESDAEGALNNCDDGQRRSRRRPWGEQSIGDRYGSENVEDCSWDWCYSPGLAVSSRRDRTNALQSGVPNPKAREIMGQWSASMIPIGVQLDQMTDPTDEVVQTDSNATVDAQEANQATPAGSPTDPQANALILPFFPPPPSPPTAHELHSIMPIVTEAIDFVEVMDQVSLGGVEFSAVEKLELSDSVIVSDAAYRELFRRCWNIRKLKVTFNKGIGILQTIIKDELLPNMTELYLCGLESFYGYSVRLSPGLLADWVELRQSTAKANTTPDGIKKLEKIMVFFSNSYQIGETDEEVMDAKAARKRIRKALRDNNSEENKDDQAGKDKNAQKKERKLFWVMPPSNDTKVKEKWEELVNENGYGDEDGEKPASKAAEGDDAKDLSEEKAPSIADGLNEEGREDEAKDREDSADIEMITFKDDEKDTNDQIKAEWPMTRAMGSPFRGWSAGPW